MAQKRTVRLAHRSWMTGPTDRSGAGSGVLVGQYDVDFEYLEVVLAFELDLPDTTLGRDLAELVKRGDVAGWFKRFLGCTDVVIALKETKKLVETIGHFADTQQLEAPQRDELMERAHLVLEEMGERGDPLTLKTVAEQIFPDAPARLAETLQDEALDLATGFVPDKRALRPLIRFKAAAADWKLEFERSSLRGGSVHYDKESNTLVLSNIPAKLRQMLLEE